MPTPEHNPQSIPPSYIPPDLRLCRESEREKLPKDAKYFLCYGRWILSDFCNEVVPTDTWLQTTYFTATPLPENEREEPAASPWIPMSERVPTEKDWDETHAVEVVSRGVIDRRLFYTKPILTGFDEACSEMKVTHWRRVELPPLPPAPAKTQREKDKATLVNLSNTDGFITPRSAFYCALETERAHFGGRGAEEVKAEIQLYHRGAAEARALLAHLEKGQRVCDERKANIILRMIACGEVQELRALLSPPKEGETP